MSSGRLPSPPPAPEIQLTPDDQDAFGAPGSGHGEVDRHIVEENSRRRIHPGTKAAAIETGPPLVELSDINSPFVLQEHLAALHHHYTQQGKQALTRAVALQIAQAPPMVEDQAWIYELCRFLLAECNKLIVGFLFDTPPCSAFTCPEMRASEWQFLCAVHDQPKSCCAIDYCCHTLDWAANVVTDPRTFPSRLAPHTDGREELNLGQHAPPSSQTIAKSLVNVFRRVHRIFAHAWFQHRSVFWAVEAQSGLYLLFKVVCDTHRLLQGETYRLPPEAEGLDNAESPASSSASEQTGSAFQPLPLPRRGEEEDPLHHTPIGRSNTRRHIRGSPSTGSAVTTVMEADEEESAAASRGRLGGMRAKVSEVSPSRLEAHDEGEETTSVPVIVEHVEDNEPSNVCAPTPPPDVDAAADSDDDAATTILHDDDADIGDGANVGGEAEGASEGTLGDAAAPEEAGDAPVVEADSGSDSGKDGPTPDSSDQEHSSDVKGDVGDVSVGEKEEALAAEAGEGSKEVKGTETGAAEGETEGEMKEEGEDEKKDSVEADADRKVEQGESEAQDEVTAEKKEGDAKVEGGGEDKGDAGTGGDAPN